MLQTSYSHKTYNCDGKRLNLDVPAVTKYRKLPTLRRNTKLIEIHFMSLFCVSLLIYFAFDSFDTKYANDVGVNLKFQDVNEMVYVAVTGATNIRNDDVPGWMCL